MRAASFRESFKLFWLSLLLMASAASAQPRAIMEGIPASATTILISTRNVRVGIGLSSPNSRLDVFESAAGNHIVSHDGTKSLSLYTDSTYSLFMTTTNHRVFLGANNGGAMVMLSTGGGVSIGSYGPAVTDAPSNGLIVSGNAGFGASRPIANFEIASGSVVFNSAGYNSGATGTVGPGLALYSKSSSVNSRNWIIQNGFNNFGELEFLVNKSSGVYDPLNGTTVLSMDKSGNVGIGKTNQSVPLDVAGAIAASSSMTASAFFGDGSHLTGVTSAEANTYSSTKTYTTDLLVGGIASFSSSTGSVLNTGGQAVYAKSFDGASQSSGCVVAVYTSSNAADAVMQFTSTTTTINQLNGIVAGVLLETCAPLATCRVGIRGIYRVTTASGFNGQWLDSSTTRCQVDPDNSNDQFAIGYQMTHAVSYPANTVFWMMLK